MIPDKWTPDFRLAVIAKIMAHLTDSLASQPHHTTQQDFERARHVEFVSFLPERFLTDKRNDIEAALGCTLEQVRKDMP